MFEKKENKKRDTSFEDKTFIFIQLAIVVGFAVMVFGLYIFVFQNSFKDPIIATKNNVITLQLVMIGFSLTTTLIVTIFTRNKKRLIEKLKLIVILSILMIIAQLAIKIYMDNKYNEEEFERIYVEANPEDKDYKKEISVGLFGIKITRRKGSLCTKKYDSILYV